MAWPRPSRAQYSRIVAASLTARRRSSLVRCLQELHQVALGVLERRDPGAAVVRWILDELDPGRLQTLPVGIQVVGGEGGHVPRGIYVLASHLAVRAQREPRGPFVTEDDEALDLLAHLQAQQVTV